MVKCGHVFLPQPTVLSLTPAEWDKWYKTAYQPSLPKK